MLTCQINNVVEKEKLEQLLLCCVTALVTSIRKLFRASIDDVVAENRFNPTLCNLANTVLAMFWHFQKPKTPHYETRHNSQAPNT